MNLTKLILPGQVIIFWPVWSWYFTRMLDGSDEPWGILALCTTVIILMIRKKANFTPTKKSQLISSSIIFIYLVSYLFVPPLIRGVLAMMTLAFSISTVCYGRTIQAGILGLLLLSLPLIASLQFYGGFPIRVITAYLSSQILNLVGYSVSPQGTLLYWLGETIAVDAPCAGIKMLWTGLYLNFTLATWRELGFIATWVSTSFTLFSVFVGNVVRATLLFFTESGIINAPDITHQAIGLLVFAIVASAVFSCHRILKVGSPCAI